jgi:hypothetical protein
MSYITRNAETSQLFNLPKMSMAKNCYLLRRYFTASALPVSIQFALPFFTNREKSRQPGVSLGKTDTDGE